MSSLHMLMNFNTCRGLGHTARTLQIAASLSKALGDRLIPARIDHLFPLNFCMTRGAAIN
jgi:hypothetical protein